MPTMKVYRDSVYADVSEPIASFSMATRLAKYLMLKASHSIPAGAHKLVARIDWCGSCTVDFVATEDADSTFMVKSNLRGIRIFKAAYFTTRAKNSYLSLRQVSNHDVKQTIQKPLSFNLRRAVFWGAVVWGIPFALIMWLSQYLQKGVLLDPVGSAVLLLASLAGGMVFGVLMRSLFQRRHGQLLEKMKAGQPPAV